MQILGLQSTQYCKFQRIFIIYIENAENIVSIHFQLDFRVVIKRTQKKVYQN